MENEGLWPIRRSTRLPLRRDDVNCTGRALLTREGEALTGKARNRGGRRRAARPDGELFGTRLWTPARSHDLTVAHGDLRGLLHSSSSRARAFIRQARADRTTRTAAQLST